MDTDVTWLLLLVLLDYNSPRLPADTLSCVSCISWLLLKAVEIRPSDFGTFATFPPTYSPHPLRSQRADALSGPVQVFGAIAPYRPASRAGCPGARLPKLREAPDDGSAPCPHAERIIAAYCTRCW